MRIQAEIDKDRLLEPCCSGNSPEETHARKIFRTCGRFLIVLMASELQWQNVISLFFYPPQTGD
jgi:hypothetical protein